jgi:hypothetical protein
VSVVLIRQFCYGVAASASCDIGNSVEDERTDIMSREINPVAGRWYRDLERDEIFKVVAVEENDDLVEIQHADGEIEEIESAEWFEMDIERAGEPEGWLREDEDAEEEDEKDDDDEDDDDDDWDDDDEDDDEDDDLDDDDDRDDY